MAPRKCFEPRLQMEIPTMDIVSFCFASLPPHLAFDRNKPLYIDADDLSRSISSNQAQKIIRQLVCGFRKAGLQCGDVVCITSFNDIFYPMIFNAVIGAQGIVTGSNPAYTAQEYIHHLRASEAKYLLVEPDLLDNALVAAKACSIPLKNIWLFNPRNLSCPSCPVSSWTWLLQQGEDDWHRFDDIAIARSTTAARLFSSGTTGLPKAANISHYNLVAHHVIGMEHPQYKKEWEVIRILPLPFFHASSVSAVHHAVLRLGITAYVMRRFDLEGYLRNAERFKLTEIAVVPPIAISIIMSPLSKKYSLKSVRFGQAGAAPLDKDSQNRLLQLLHPAATFTQVYGQSESTCIISQFPPLESNFTGSVGRMNPNVYTKIVDDDGRNITDYNVNGEILIKSPSTFQGYHKVDNSDTFDHEGYYKTGDIGFCDSDGKWYIVDRKKELIKVRGFQVAPPEIEAVLLAHPFVVDAAVIGVPDYRSGELPRAYVVRRLGIEESALSEKGVYDFVAQKLAKYKRLEGGVKFVNAIPKNPSGKILKRILREEAKKEAGSLANAKL